jgi:predicted enzyme related to lactoylglutathione lyase
MPKTTTFPTGAPIWVELMTSDPDGAAEFYGEIFGWTAESPNEEFGGYVNLSKGDERIAGCMRNDGSAATPDLWSVYLASPNAAKTVEAATARGAQVVVPPMEVGDLGTMAVVIDAGGAAVGVWQPGTHAGFDLYGEHGAPGWFELHTLAYDDAVKFYEEVFEWETHVASDDPEFRYTTFGKDEDGKAGIMDATTASGDGEPSHWRIYFTSDDVDATLARVAELGGTVVQGPDDTPYGRLAVAADPTGARFALASS